MLSIEKNISANSPLLHTLSCPSGKHAESSGYAPWIPDVRRTSPPWILDTAPHASWRSIQDDRNTGMTTLDYSKSSGSASWIPDVRRTPASASSGMTTLDYSKSSGFTVVELVIGISIAVILGAAAVVYMRGAIIEVASDSVARELASVIRQAKGRTEAGDLGAAWGVRTIHSSGSGADRFEFFATSTALGTPLVNTSAFPAGDVHVLPGGAKWAVLEERSVIFLPAISTTSPVQFSINHNNKVTVVSVATSGDVVIQ